MFCLVSQCAHVKFTVLCAFDDLQMAL